MPGRVELFDLATDLSEATNLAEANPKSEGISDPDHGAGFANGAAAVHDRYIPPRGFRTAVDIRGFFDVSD